MAWTIDYQGDADWLMGVVLEKLARDQLGGPWYVQIERYDGTEIEGRLVGVEMVESQLGEKMADRVTVAESTGEWAQGFPIKPDGEEWVVPVEDVARLVVP